MRFLLKLVIGLAVVYVGLGLLADGLIGYFQPQTEDTIVITTYDAEGAHDTVLSLRDDDDQLWVESGHWFRGWYHRLLENPDVEVTFPDGRRESFTAVPVNTPEAVALMEKLMGKGDGYGYWIGRTILLFAPIKPVRLDPREVAEPDIEEDTQLSEVDGTFDETAHENDEVVLSEELDESFEDSEPPSGAEPIAYAVTAEDEARYITSCIERDRFATEIANDAAKEFEKEFGEKLELQAFNEDASRSTCTCQQGEFKKTMTPKQYAYLNTVWTLDSDASAEAHSAMRNQIEVTEDEEIDILAEIAAAEFNISETCQ